MELKIDEKGSLFIKRKDVYKITFCPYITHDGIDQVCGDWCALFGEPVIEKSGQANSLEICNKIFHKLDVLIDERK